MEVKRNDPCPCGSGKKYKKCCGLRAANAKQSARSFYTGPSSLSPAQALTNRIIKVLESDDTLVAPANVPDSKASTEEAENPELAPPI